jgi:hypothetical protein
MRQIVLDEVGPCHESIFPIKKWISILYSTTEKRMKDNICLLVVYKDHVNLMFPRGVDLNDLGTPVKPLRKVVTILKTKPAKTRADLPRLF